MLQDDVFARLLTFPNVLIPGNQGFFTREAMTAIAETTIHNISSFEETGRAAHQIGPELLACASMGGGYREPSPLYLVFFPYGPPPPLLEITPKRNNTDIMYFIK